MPNITIVPFENIEKDIINSLKNNISDKFKSRVDIYPRKLNLPHYRKRANQLHAHDFLPAVNKLVKDYGIGITNQDLYVPDLNYVFGVAFGKNCIISLARLRGDLFVERAVKEAVHELGHCFRLNHCCNSKCVMYFSNTLSDTDNKEKEFCESCKYKLKFK